VRVRLRVQMFERKTWVSVIDMISQLIANHQRKPVAADRY